MMGEDHRPLFRRTHRQLPLDPSPVPMGTDWLMRACKAAITIAALWCAALVGGTLALLHYHGL